MSRSRGRLVAGTLLYDWPRFAVAMTGPGNWVRYRNRNERLSFDDRTGGARCEWRYTSDLHICAVHPFAGSWLLRRALREWPIRFAAAPTLSEQPSVSFVVGHRGQSRVPHLLATLATIAAQAIVPVECVVVEQSAVPILLSVLPTWVRYVHTPIESDTLPYNRSAALNAGVAIARAPLVVLHDNDFLVPQRYAAELVARHSEGWEFIDLKRFMFYCTQEDSERIARSSIIPNRVVAEKVVQNLLAGGSVAADRRAFDEVGRMDEAFIGWGGEDNEFWERATTRKVWTHAYLPLLHLWHAPQPERLDGPNAAAVQRYRQLKQRSPEERIRVLTAVKGLGL